MYILLAYNVDSSQLAQKHMGSIVPRNLIESGVTGCFEWSPEKFHVFLLGHIMRVIVYSLPDYKFFKSQDVHH